MKHTLLECCYPWSTTSPSEIVVSEAAVPRLFKAILVGVPRAAAAAAANHRPPLVREVCIMGEAPLLATNVAAAMIDSKGKNSVGEEESLKCTRPLDSRENRDYFEVVCIHSRWLDKLSSILELNSFDLKST